MKELGGEIICQSKWGHGTTFSFVIKLQPKSLDSDNSEQKERVLHPITVNLYPKVNIREEINRRQEGSIEGDSDAVSEEDKNDEGAETARLSDIKAKDV